ncbi:class II fructose-bisphosphate aldolase [Candidatus Southlakia epibionticum]|uniref:Class II fructose-bisphosphate aldolase n=1 Tax=Candidatus Southlakia epibionticum TaxID=3043284 RepID=A0ABY8WVR2_9BACT|nr:Class II fructose-bisphosphate aldolase [Candidatus Saccharimonadaceae bacterium ML1]
MSLITEQIYENTARARELMHRSRQEGFAVGAFNIDNQETLQAISQAAQKLQAPVMVEVSAGEVKTMGGCQNIRDMVSNYRSTYNIEMYINLDHAPTVELCQQAIDAGFEFIHIDISQANHDATLEEIIMKTKDVVAYARSTGALVEAEERYFFGDSNVHKEAIDYEEVKKWNTKPNEARDFVAATGIDTMAVQIGNLHGLYPVPKILDLDLLREIRAAIDCQISLHGGSGTPLHYFEDAAKIGVSKININSDLRYAFRTTLEKVLRENPDEYAVYKLMPQVCAAVQAVVEEKIQAFGSVGKAA